MSAETHPTTDVTPATNGAVPGGDPRPDLPRWEEGPNKLPLTVAWREYIRDLRWVNTVLFRGELAEYPNYVGNYVAVWEEKVVAFGPNLLELHEQLKKLPGMPADRVLIEYIPTAPDE